MLMNAKPRYLSVTRMPFARIPLIRIFVLVNLELLQMGELALVRGFTVRFFLKILNQFIIKFGYNACCHWLKERAL